MKVPYQQCWLILWCWTNQVPIKQTMALSRTTETAIRHWYELFRAHLPEDPVILEHIVQMDEAYFKKTLTLVPTE